MSQYAVPFVAIPFPVQTCMSYQPYNLIGAKTSDDLDGDGIPEAITARFWK